MAASLVHNNPYRVLSLARFSLATVFFLAIAVDANTPDADVARSEIAARVLAAYVIFSATELAVAWNRWWLSPYVAISTHAIDIVVFALIVFLDDGYLSPFFIFFAFPLLASSILWGASGSMFSAAALVFAFLGAGLVAFNLGIGGFDLQRLLIRCSFLAVFSLILIWLSRQNGVLWQFPAEVETGIVAASSEIPDTLNSLREAFRGTRAAIYWWDSEEPWLNLACEGENACPTVRFWPDDIDQDPEALLRDRPFLFREKDDLLLEIDKSGRSKRAALSREMPRWLFDRSGIKEGLGLSIRSTEGAAIVLVGGVPALSQSDLAAGRLIMAQLSERLTGRTASEARREIESGGARAMIAHDIHDGVVQLLTGISFRLASIRRSVEDPQVVAELAELATQIADEQREIREKISALRGPHQPGRIDLNADLKGLCLRSEKRWSVSVPFKRSDENLEVDRQFAQDIGHLLQEAIANSVRHGKASVISVALIPDNGNIKICVSDNGIGFAQENISGEIVQADRLPVSLKGRIECLGGQLEIFSRPENVRVVVRLPGGDEQ